jgi:ecotin
MSYCKITAPYPPAPRGEKRIVFALDPHGDDVEHQQFMLQLIPARAFEMSKTTAANHLMLHGKVVRHNVKGYDAPYFHVELARNFASTLMALEEDDGEKVYKSVPMAQPPLFPYSSAHPVVVYLPQDADLHYSVWYGGESMQATSE